MLGVCRRKSFCRLATPKGHVMMRIRLNALLSLLLLAGIFVHGVAAKEEAAKTKRIKASNVVELRENASQRVTVYGRIESTGAASSGHNFLNFSGKQVTVFCHKNDVAKFKDGKPAEVYKGKDVEITGVLSLYQNKLQLKLTDPSHIKIIDLSATPKIKPIELREIGKDAWLSPAGLRYEGRDPQRLTRVEHIMRHVSDQPNRNGPHGVFDGGKGVAFAVIDEAWNLAQKKKLRPKNEGDRSSYTVRMNRRVGYLGGSLGKSKGHPPLDRVFIVFETGTKKVITAFPR